jgi:hypothetical protein
VRLLAALLSIAITGGCAHEENVCLKRRSAKTEVVPPPDAPADDDLEAWLIFEEARSQQEEDPGLGRVLSVAPDADLGSFVAISMGANDGVRIGWEFDIYRDHERVGRIEIIRVSSKRAFGRLDTKPGVLPDVQQNDRVVLRLPEGRVLSVKMTAVGTFVAISVGSKDGVRVGDHYHVSHGDSYVMRIIVVRVDIDSAYARAKEGFYSSSSVMRVGYRAWAE